MAETAAVRIAVLQWGSSGGGPLFALMLSTAIGEMGNLAAVSYCRDAEIAEKLKGTSAASLPISTFHSKLGAVARLPALLISSIRLRRFMHRNDVDVLVVAMEQLWTSIAMPLIRSRNRPVLLFVHDATMHPGDSNRIEDFTRKFGRRFADGAIVLSSPAKTALERSGQFPADRIWRTVHGAFGGRGAVVARTGIDRHPPVIGMFGRISEYKGFGLGYDAIRRLRDEGFRVKFRIVGAGDYSLLARFDHPDDELDLRWVPDREIQRELMNFDILLLPYTEASQSGVLAYAMTLGIPSVVTPVGGLREQGEESGVAVVTESLTPTAVADALRRLLLDHEYYAKLSEAGIAKSSSSFSWRRVAHDTSSAAASLFDMTADHPRSWKAV